MGLEQRLKLGLAVERGVVEDDRLAGPKFEHEHLGEPGLDDAAVTPVKVSGANTLPTHQAAIIEARSVAWPRRSATTGCPLGL